MDPDDVVALCICLAHPRIELVGIVVSPGYQDQVGLVRSILAFTDRLDIPIGVVPENKYSPFRYFSPGVHDRHVDCMQRLGVPVTMYDGALDGPALVERLATEHDDLVLVTIGPIQVVKDWIAMQPGHATIHQSYTMGGYHATDREDNPLLSPEYNFNASVDGALALASTRKIGRKVVVSKNVTHHVFYTDELDARVVHVMRQSKPHQVIHQIMVPWHDYPREAQLMHDPLTVCVSIDESIVRLAGVRLVYDDMLWGSSRHDKPDVFISTGKAESVQIDKFERIFLEHRARS